MSDSILGNISVVDDGYGGLIITSVNGGTITTSNGGYAIISGNGTAASSGSWCIPISTGGNWTSGTTGVQIPLPDIDLAVPVAKKKKDSDGCSCKKCKEYFPYAEPNQDDGTLVCYGCRMRW